MGFTAKAKASCSGGSENWGMGFLLVFFPEEQVDKGKTSSAPSPSSSSSSSSLGSTHARIKRSSSSLILTRAQSTISICALLVFVTLLLFTLSTFEPTIPINPALPKARRFLRSGEAGGAETGRGFLASSLLPKLWVNKSEFNVGSNAIRPAALQRIGVLYLRGTRAMNDLVVAHVGETVTGDELRLFLRLLHRSGVGAKADLAFIFANSSSEFGPVIQEENEFFLELLERCRERNGTAAGSPASFDVAPFMGSGKKEKPAAEPIWGKRNRSNGTYPDSPEVERDPTRPSYGSIVGFEASELDPEDSLAGFLDHVPMSMRRWACYPMLLGRVRRKFKHIVLVDAKSVVIVGDPLSGVRNRSPESVLIWGKTENSPVGGKHRKKNSEKPQPRFTANPAVLMGGDRGVRRFSNAMLTEVVRAAMQPKKKSSVSESGVLSQLVGNEFLLKDSVNLVTSEESVPEASALGGSKPGYSIIQRGNGNDDFNYTVMKQICAGEVESSVYRDC